MARTVIPFGPQHPVFPEPIQLKLELEDEKVLSAIPQIGYIARGIEKGAELNEFRNNIFLCERICGICSFTHALCYCQGVEDLMGIEEIPPRAKYLRTFWSELSRMHSHLLWLGLLCDSFGFESLFMQIWRAREVIMDISEKTAGHRVIQSTCTMGGVRRDLSPEIVSEVRKMLADFRSQMDAIMPVILNDPTVKTRTVGKGPLSYNDAILLGAVGPTLRGSGVAEDMRMLGYAAYKEIGFEPVVEDAGDSYARALVRAREIYQSMDIILKTLDDLPSGDIQIKVRGNPPQGEVISRAEQPRGEVFYFIKGNGTKNLERLKVRTPTFANIPPLLAMLPGCEMADVPVITLSIDPCIACTER